MLFAMSAVIWQACEYEVVPAEVNCQESPVALELVSVDGSGCALANGSIEVRASGGNGNYRFMISEGPLQSSARFENLSAGLYQVTAVDGNNCSASLEATVLNSDGLNVTFTTTSAGGCNGSDGTLTVNAVDGMEPYRYRMGGGPFSQNQSFTGLSRGEYTLTVADASGCEITQKVRILSGISFAVSIAPIIKANCAINDCHNGSQFPDLRTFKNVHDNAGQIKALTGDRTMPQDGSLTQTQINMIACWVDDGAPDN